MRELAEALREQAARLGEIGFAAPERFWFAAPLLLVLLLAPWRRTTGRRGAAALVLRAAGLLALVAVLAEPRVPHREEHTGRVALLVDVSPSAAPGAIARAHSLLAAAPGTKPDLVAFGAEAKTVGDVAALAPDPRPRTDLAAALRLAAARADPARPFRVAAVTDGRATEPGAARAARDLRAAGVEVFAFRPEGDAEALPANLAVRGLVVPPRARRRASFPVTARVHAAAARPGTAMLFVDGREVARRELAFPAGDGEVVFPDVRLEPGRYHVQVLLAGDRRPEDDVAGRDVVVPGTPRVLFVGRESRKALLAEALKLQGFAVEVGGPERLSDLEGVDTVVLLPDAPAGALQQHAARLEEFVGRRGGGLLAVGGTDGAGLARFFDTALAGLLPVDVPARPPPAPEPTPPPPDPGDEPKVEIVEEETEAFPITLCLVVDRSGSMRGEKIRRAQQAAVAAAQALTKEDRVAVVSFGNDATLDVAPRAAGDPRAVARALGGLQAVGNTAMFAGLARAARLMRAETTPIRHVILMTDGVSSDSGKWRDVVKALADEKITLSSLAIGWDADRLFLAQLARWGRGRYWSASDPYRIPQVVTQDTLRVREARDRRGDDAERARPDEPDKPDRDEKEREPEEKQPEERSEPEKPEPPPAIPIVAAPEAPREMLRGVPDEQLPAVAGVEQGEPRFSAWVAARAGTDGPPVLAYHRVGLGTAAALLVDPEAPGGRALAEHGEFTRLAAQLVRSVLPDAAREPVALRHERRPEGGESEVLVLRVLGEDGQPRTDLPVAATVDDEPRAVVARLRRYEAALPPRDAPARVRVVVGPPAAPLLERAFVVPATVPPEFRVAGTDETELLHLAGAPRRVEASPSRALRPPVVVSESSRPLWLPFLFLAAILLPFDAWARRRASASP